MPLWAALVCGVFAAVLELADGQGTRGCTDSWAQNFDPAAQAEDGNCSYTCPGLLQHADQARLAGATCFVHSDGWPSALTDSAISSPKDNPTHNTLPVSSNAESAAHTSAGKMIVQGIPSSTSAEPTSSSRTSLAYRFQVGAASGEPAALALRHVSATDCLPNRCTKKASLTPRLLLWQQVSLQPPDSNFNVYSGGGVEVMSGSYAILMNVTFDSIHITASTVRLTRSFSLATHFLIHI